MKNVVLFILSIFVILGILNLIEVTADWISANVPPFVIFSVIVLGISALGYFIIKEEE